MISPKEVYRNNGITNSEYSTFVIRLFYLDISPIYVDAFLDLHGIFFQMDESPRSDNTDQPKHVALEQAVSVTDFSQPSSETDLTKALDIDSYDEDEVCH